MTVEDQHVQARLTRLAQLAPQAEDGSTADRAVAVDHARRLRAGRWTAAAVAVVVLGTAATLARPADLAPVPLTTPQGPPPPALYEQPPRGSLADDPEFLTAVAALPWSAPRGSGFVQPDPATRRVVYAADVPGGHRWAVVLAGSGQQWVLDWFTGPRGAGPDELTEAIEPTLYAPAGPLALMDVSADTGPLVLLTGPGVTAEYSATLDRAPGGGLFRDMDPLPVVDGVPVGMVRTPITYDPTTGAELHQVRNGVDEQVRTVLTTGTPPWARTDVGTGRPDPADVAACLGAEGFTVQAAPPSAGVYYEDPRTGDLTSVEQAARDRASEGCFLGAGQD